MAQEGSASPSSESGLPVGLTKEDKVLLFDGVCLVCSAWVHFVIARDPEGRIKMASVQSEAGQAILAHFGMPTDDFDTMVFVEGGAHYIKSTAFLRAVRYLTFPWPLLRIGLLMPRFLRDFFYSLVANNRYRLFGKKDVCMIPSPEIRERFVGSISA